MKVKLLFFRNENGAYQQYQQIAIGFSNPDNIEGNIDSLDNVLYDAASELPDYNYIKVLANNNPIGKNVYNKNYHEAIQEVNEELRKIMKGTKVSNEEVVELLNKIISNLESINSTLERIVKGDK